MTRYKNINGVKIKFTQAEETARDIEETAWNNGDLDRALKDLRDKRNQLISETDYLALPDVVISEDMTTYRQALRDITNGLTTVEQVEAVVFPTRPGV